MLELYIESGRRLRQLRQSSAGEHLDGFADWLHLAGYKQRPAQLTQGALAASNAVAVHGSEPCGALRCPTKHSFGLWLECCIIAFEQSIRFLTDFERL